MKRKRRPPAVAPTNVRMISPDGTEFPLELVYEGFVDGEHVWRAVHLPHMRLDESWRILAEELPPHTAIRCAVVER